MMRSEHENEAHSLNPDDRGTFSVRQILYLIPRDGSPMITPVQVTEEIRRTTLDGTKITYAVRDAGTADDAAFVLNDQHEAFPTIALLRAELLRRATNALDELVNAAVVQAAAAFPGAQSVRGNEEDGPSSESAPAGTVAVMLPDGQTVRARISGSSK